jgi:DNA modification methylase
MPLTLNAPVAPKVELIPISNLRPSPRNARTHSKKQIRQIANSMTSFGWTYPILVDEAHNIIAGHGRLEAAKLLQFQQVPVIEMAGLNETQKRLLALADNKIAANAGYDRAMLATELGDLAILLPECDLDLNITGFEPAEIDALLGDFSDPEADPADAIPSIEQQAVSAAGDVWQLGPHRLLCGDSLSPDSYQQLLGTERAQLTIADPPYNVKVKDIQGRGKIKHREFQQASGELSRTQFTEFLGKAMTLAATHSAPGSVGYWFMDWRHLTEILAAGESAYAQLLNLVVWAKTNGGQGSLYRSAHELVLVYKSGDEPHLNNVELGKFGRNRTNVWNYAGVNTFRAGRLEELAIHPTVKPTALVADAMLDCSRRGHVVLDPFMGSGTTIMAAERVGRRAYGIELDPLFVDVAVRRWQAVTRRDATLSATGAAFDEVAERREPTNIKGAKNERQHL